MKVYIQASSLVMTQEEMLSKVPKEKLEMMKGKGILQAYTLAHEGQSRPKILGEKSKILTWTKAVIHRLKDKIKSGAKFFINHGNNTNAHDGRQSVGEVVTSFVKDVGGRLANIVIGHFPDEQIVKDSDVCSMEAEINEQNSIVNDIEEVTGIALGNSNKEHPAFPGAVRLNAVQCFYEDIKETSMEKKITFNEIKEAVRAMNIFPWQLFTVEDLKKDTTFNKIFDDNSKLSAENERLKEELTTIKKDSEEAIRQANLSSARKTLDKLMEKGYTDLQKTRIVEKFDPEKLEDTSEAGVKKYLEQAEKDYAEDAKFFMVSGGSTDQNSQADSNNEETLDEEGEALKVLGV